MAIANAIIRAAEHKLEALENSVVNGVSKNGEIDFYGVDIDDPVPLRLQILGLTDVRFLDDNGLTPEEEKILLLIDAEAEGMLDPEFLSWRCWEEDSDFLPVKNKLLALYQKLGLDIVSPPTEEIFEKMGTKLILKPNESE